MLGKTGVQDHLEEPDPSGLLSKGWKIYEAGEVALNCA